MSISKRNNGSYRIQVYFKKPDGTFGRLSADRRTLKEAKDAEALLILKSKGTEILPSQATFAAVSTEFIEAAKIDHRMTSMRSLIEEINYYLIPFFGNMSISEITPIIVKEWKDKMAKIVSTRTHKPFTFTYLHKIYSALRLVFSYAFKEYGIRNDSLDRVGGFKKDPNAPTPSPVLHYWTLDQFRGFQTASLNYLSTQDPMDVNYMKYWGAYVLLNICFFAGLRKGEANALTVADFHDVGFPFIRVTKSLTEKLKGKTYLITNPKTSSSVRDVPIPSELARLLREHIDHRLCRVQGFGPEMFLCGGSYPVTDTLCMNFKCRIEGECHLEHIRIHDFRHSYVSMLINSGVPITTISKLVGHADPSITWGIYGHLYPATSNDAITLMNNLISSTPKKEISKS